MDIELKIQLRKIIVKFLIDNNESEFEPRGYKYPELASDMADAAEIVWDASFKSSQYSIDNG